MLFYERRKKKPLQLLVKDNNKASKNEEEAKDPKEEKKEDQKRLEVNYNDAVVATEAPNRIFEQVLEDNRKFGFENDIYSAEFFDFVLGIQKAALNLEGVDEAT